MFRKLKCAFKIIREIRNLDQDYELDKLVDFTYTRCLGLIKPSQVRKEFLELLIILNRIKPDSILEIGTESGGTLFLFSRIASENAHIISVDIPSGPFGGGYHRWKIPLYKSFALPHQKIHLIRKDSHDRATFEKVKAILGGKDIDILFIDGDHTYEGVKKDFEMYSPLVKKDGIIALHDIVPHLETPTCEVNRFWNALKIKYEHEEIVDNWNQNWAGIGLIKKDANF